MQKMKHTSDANIANILTCNCVNSLDELNKHEVVRINLCDLNGYINLADFARSAYEIYLRAEHKDFEYFNHYYGDDKEFKILAVVNKLNNSVDLDASHAGDFSEWRFSNSYEHHFIKSITLRHPNQVWHFGQNPFRVKNDDLHQMIQDAKITARDRNIAEFMKNMDYQIFHQNLKEIQDIMSWMTHHNNEINVYKAQIKAIEAKINAEKKELLELKETRDQKLKHIEVINGNLDPEQQLSLELISKKLFETQKSDYDPGSEQNFEYEYLTKSTINEMKLKNSFWYSNMNNKVK